MGWSRHWPVALYDRAYRLWHRLDRPATEVGPALRVAFRRARRARRLSDGSAVARGDRVGVLHVNNERVRALHAAGRDPRAIGLGFRRDMVASLHALAALARPGGPAADAAAFVATTIHGRGLGRLGFEPDPRPLAWSALAGAYQRALLAALHPAGGRRLARLGGRRAQRLWLSRARLLARYAGGGAAGGAGGPGQSSQSRSRSLRGR
jgi:hypothetical protein